MSNKNQIKVALAGVGNLSSALVQAVEYYKKHSTRELMYPKMGGLSIPDIIIVAAFDVDERKVGFDLSKAIFAPPNNQREIMELPESGVIVQKSPLLDGLSEYTHDVVKVSTEADVNVSEVLKATGAELLILNTPSGAEEAVNYLTQAALDAGVGVINSTPSLVVGNSNWVKKFKEKSLPLIGDDLQSQAGGTVFHKGLLEILNEQAVVVEDTYQLDVSGGLEGLTTLDYERRSLKRGTKENSIKRSLPYDIRVAAGTTDYLDFLGSRRIGHYWVFGKSFLGQDVKIDIRMEIDDSNGAASLVDAIRAAKLAMRKGISGPVNSICAHLFKMPPVSLSRKNAAIAFEEFVTS
ncbi:MAG: Inositol-3-phosphate synthase [Candidatus Heimdallarchaeota archaeon LC_2]|nr:MAG: Inositol-3-phosphate synthase [Candidatus Heimdallarchaeota archaeon LC_2]